MIERRTCGDLCLSLADELGDDYMTTNAVHALPGEVLFHVEVMRQEMKTVKTAPHEEVAAAIEKMEEEINLLFEKQARLPRKWQRKRASTNFGEAAPRPYDQQKLDEPFGYPRMMSM
jgi:hypothetical protein